MSPAKEAGKEELLCPDHTVDGLVWCVSDRTNWVGFGGRFALTLIAICHYLLAL